ncbi:hypothetical protein HPP92_006095 [Vanilla planifolia]|uniref:Uncharacterized protein n=1 Tax=Vanilla planifolia TaxID=51239 RepID=A0A835VG08_VANPL|nr:hypothetical protein HPP92_006411 [Vanilla planifolia]KAG0495101.1 hypothetical protein HPP92_006095 [Vanilla planifolia]
MQQCRIRPSRRKEAAAMIKGNVEASAAFWDSGYYGRRTAMARVGVGTEFWPVGNKFLPPPPSQTEGGGRPGEVFATARRKTIAINHH